MDSQFKVMILGANSYNFEDNRTGRTVSGTTVHVVYLTDEQSDTRVGYGPSEKVTFPNERYLEKFKNLEFPCVANAQLEFVPNRRKPFRVVDFDILGPIEMGVVNG